MNTLNFNEDQRVIIHLPELTQNDKPGNEDLSKRGEESRNKGDVELMFNTEDYEFTTNPSKEQLNALEYIKTHQKELLEAFYKYTKEVLYPVHIEFIGYDEISFPELKSLDDLRKSLGIFEILIWKHHKEDTAYVAYWFEFTGDFEHGVILIAHKNRILGWEEDLVDDKIIADLGKSK